MFFYVDVLFIYTLFTTILVLLFNNLFLGGYSTMIKTLKKSLILSASLALLLPNVANADMNVSRISGKDRYDTATKVQQNYYTKANGNLAIIASGSDFRTSLYGSYMANSLKVPFYVIPNTGMSKAMFNELKDKQVNRAYVMGDYKLLNRSIDNSLKSIGIKVTRFYDRYEDGFYQNIFSYIDTPIFETFFPGEPRGDVSCAIIINDKKFPDLLSSIPFVSTLAREQATYLASYQSFETTSDFKFIIGGYSTVPSYIKTLPGDHMGLNIHSWDNINFDDDNIFYTGRIAGQDRYKTAIEIAKAYKPVLKKNITTAVIVDGTNYPDALASGTVAIMNNGAILLTNPKKLSEDTKSFIQESNIKNIIIVGGEKSVSKDVENELKGL